MSPEEYTNWRERTLDTVSKDISELRFAHDNQEEGTVNLANEISAPKKQKYWLVPFPDGISIRQVRPRNDIPPNQLSGTMTVLHIFPQDTYFECAEKFVDLLNKLEEEHQEELKVPIYYDESCKWIEENGKRLYIPKSV